MPELTTIYDYMRANAPLLGQRILQEYPALHPFNDPVSPRIETLLRRPFPAQTIALMGVVKRWQYATFGREVGTGSLPDRPWNSRVLDRRLAERRRREYSARCQRSAAQARPDCAVKACIPLSAIFDCGSSFRAPAIGGHRYARDRRCSS